MKNTFVLLVAAIVMMLGQAGLVAAQTQEPSKDAAPKAEAKPAESQATRRRHAERGVVGDGPHDPHRRADDSVQGDCVHDAAEGRQGRADRDHLLDRLHADGRQRT